jgi:hypothetical protein
MRGVAFSANRLCLYGDTPSAVAIVEQKSVSLGIELEIQKAKANVQLMSKPHRRGAGSLIANSYRGILIVNRYYLHRWQSVTLRRLSEQRRSDIGDHHEFANRPTIS